MIDPLIDCSVCIVMWF